MHFCFIKALPVQTTVFDDIQATDFDANRNKDILFNIVSGNTYVSVYITLH